MKNLYKTILFAVAVLLTQSKNTCAQIVYSNDFESGAAGWTVGNSLKTCDGYFSVPSSWAVTDMSGGVAVGLGSHTMGNKNDGSDGAENGWIISPDIFVPGSTLVVDLDSWVSNEQGFPCYYDAEFIEISTDGGASFYPIHGYVVGLHNLTNDMTWRHLTFTTSVTANTNIKLRLRMDTGDPCCGYDSRGWFVDNLVLTSVAPVVITFNFNSTNIACNGGSDGTISFDSITGGTAPYLYSIDGGATYQDSPVFTSLSAGTYQLQVEDAANHVSEMENATIITANDTMAPTAVCKNILVQLDSSGVATITASDIDGGSTDNCVIASITISKSTFDCSTIGDNTVTLTVIDNSYNVSTCTAVVTIADQIAPAISCPANITSAISACNGSSAIVNWNTPDVWDNCTFTVTSSHHSGDRFNVGTTTVTYTVTDASHNSTHCSFTVTVSSVALAISSISSHTYAGGYNVSCKGKKDGQATVSVTGGCMPYTYKWSTTPVQKTATASSLAAGTYTVVVTDAKGTKVSATIMLTEPALLVANAGNDQTVYQGYAPNECVTLNGTASGGTPAYSYSWSNGASSASTSVCPTVTKCYALTVTDANGCVAKSNTTVFVLNVKCSPCGNGVITGYGNKVMICHNAGNNHRSVICVDASAVPAHLAHGDKLGACDNGNCSGGFSSRSSEDETSTISTNAPSVFMIYPNPSSGAFTIQSDADGSYTIFNQLGEAILDVQLNVSNNYTVKIDHLKAGTYFISGTSNGQRVNEKIIVDQ